MSANIYYRPVSTDRTEIDTMSPSHILDSLKNAFGELPIVLSEKDKPTLHGMASVGGQDCESRGSFKQIINAIDKYEIIQIWEEW